AFTLLKDVPLGPEVIVANLVRNVIILCSSIVCKVQIILV
ncbi:7933_t:CDS:1, partial [Gigaspora rosea]